MEDRLETAGPRGRREILDDARRSIGMDDIATEQAVRKWEVANSALRWGPDADGKRLTQCAAPDCTAMPTWIGGVSPDLARLRPTREPG